jgi:hypothetical protein
VTKSFQALLHDGSQAATSSDAAKRMALNEKATIDGDGLMSTQLQKHG